MTTGALRGIPEAADKAWAIEARYVDIPKSLKPVLDLIDREIEQLSSQMQTLHSIKSALHSSIGDLVREKISQNHETHCKLAENLQTIKRKKRK